MNILTIPQKIRQRRAQMLVHSCLYYEMDNPIISDDQWQIFADDLTQIQKENPKECKIGFFDKEFRDWNGTTGMHLPHRHPWVYNKALQLLKLEEKYGPLT